MRFCWGAGQETFLAGAGLDFLERAQGRRCVRRQRQRWLCGDGVDWLPMFSFLCARGSDGGEFFVEEPREIWGCNEEMGWVVYGICAR